MKLTSITRYVLIGILFPLLIQYIMYYRFTPNYQPGVFSENGFRTFYGSSVFKYRIAGTELQLWVYHLLKTNKSAASLKENKIYGKRLLALDDQADDLFYMSYFIINAFFAILLALGLLYLFDSEHLFNMSDSAKCYTTVLLQLMVAVSQFVPTPYDVAGYFFEVFSFGVFLKYFFTHQRIYYIFTCLLIIIATLVRESSALILSLMASVYFMVYGITPSWIKKMVLPCFCFLTAYLSLRIFVNHHSMQMLENSTLFKNFNLKPSTAMGLLMTVIIFYMMLKASVDKDNRNLVTSFLAFSLPYVVMIIFVGILAEIRLWLPLITGTAVLYKLNLKALRNHNYLSDLSANHTTDPQPH